MLESDPAKVGLWEQVRFRFNNLPVHVALLRTGKVLGFGGSGNDETQLATPHPAELWNPETGEFRTVDQRLEGDIFCSGHSFLPDGKLLVAGGTYKYDGKLFGLPVPPFSGLEQSYLFDPGEERWTRIGDMSKGRWYPTLVSMSNGSVVTVAGLTKGFPWVFLRTVEMYSQGAGWSKLGGAERWLPLYPRLHLLPNGEIFYTGSYNTHYTFPFSLRGFPTATLNVNTRVWTTIGPPNKSEREEGTSVLLPLYPPDYRAKVLLVGGGDTGGKVALPDAEVIDVSEHNPKWRSVQPMKNARYYAYPVILPNGLVLIVGGRKGEKGMKEMSMPPMAPGEVPQDPMAVLDAEVFDPKSERWETWAPMKLDRLYHSNALLLPDGRVMTCGSNPARRVNELRIEIFDPPYLFKGERPVIEKAPERISYGQSFKISVLHGRDTEAVTLIRLTATTHCVNTEQRYVGLEFREVSSGSIAANVTENKNVAPPGYYMLFVVSGGVPSRGRFVLLN